MTLNYILKGLDCANCASKIERELNKISSIERATVVFANKRLKIVSASSSRESLEAEVRNTIKLIEPEVELCDDSSDSELDEDINKKIIARTSAAAIALVLALLLKSRLDKISIILFFSSYLLSGIDVIYSAVKNLVRGKMFDEKLLMTIATIGAIVLGEYPEAIFVMLFYQVGELFQSYAVGKSRRSIASLMSIKPDYANIKKGNSVSVVSPQDVAIGDLIIVKPGEKIPLDGIIIDGESSVDTSALTGESVPRDLGVGDSALSGYINIAGVLTIKVTKGYGESTVYKILDMVQSSAEKKTATENFITRFARWYTPAVVAMAVAIVAVPTLFGQSFANWLYRALTFLVISCPCALVISVPLSFFGGIGGASKSGVLVKGSNYLEMLATTDTIIFDKTGTLTKGNFEVVEISPAATTSGEELLEVAAYAEFYSNHPIARPLVAKYGSKIEESLISNYKEIPGQGISATVGGNAVLAGNALLMHRYGISFVPCDNIGTVVYVAVDGSYKGHVVISDVTKPMAKQELQKLRDMGIGSLVMLTGDNKKVGDYVAIELGIDKVFAELLPDEKVKIAEKIMQEKRNRGYVAFVGDGINDAPVLARCDVGIAMGALGSDAAVEAADVVIMNDQLGNISKAIGISRKTMKISRQNIVLALAIKLIVLLLGALGVATMWEAVFADIGVSIIAILNSMRTMHVGQR